MASRCAHFSAAYAPGPAGPPGRDGRDGLPGICLKDIESISNSKYQGNTLRLLLSSSNRKCRKSCSQRAHKCNVRDLFQNQKKR